MEDSCEVHSEDKAIQEKSKKRRLKTPAQLEALEKFYSEHKYPSEELKSQFADSLGLTEKQISGWFCHRRLKDKRSIGGEASANGRQDRSSGIIQDHGSGHRQDSCGSTKEGDNRHCEIREVQSRIFSGQDLLVADLANERGHHDVGNESDMDDTSSGSSLPLQNRLHSQNEDPSHMASLTYLVETENIAPTNSIGNRIRPGPSGYLKVKGRAENPAIAAVKRQLGRHYREDGPPLSVEFDPLPPGAFESSITNTVDEPQYLGEPDLRHSPDVPQIFNKPDSITSCEVYNSKMNPRDFHVNGSNVRVMHASPDHNHNICHQPKPKPILSNRCDSFSKRNSSTEFNEGFTGEMPVYDKSKLYKMTTKHDPQGRRKDGFTGGRRDSWSCKSEDVSPEQIQREYFESKYSTVTVNRSKSHDMENRGLVKRMAKDAKFIRESNAIHESSDSARVLVHPTNEKGGKRVWEQFLERTYGRKASRVEPPLWANGTKRSAADLPSSFSEDETAETSSSGD